MSLYSDTHRALFSRAHENRNRGLTEPEDIIIHSDISYADQGEHPKWQLLDVYLPKNRSSEKLPVIVSVHGGGWVEGDKDEYRYYCMDLVRGRYAVINFSYRLAPEYPFPASLYDLEHVMGWIADHSEEYGFDTGQVFGIGDSAGGHILALYAALVTGADDELIIDHPGNVTIRALGLNCANLFFPKADELNTTQKHTFFDLLGEEPDDELLKKLKVADRVTGDFPPVYMILASRDPLRSQAIAFSKILSQKGVDHGYRLYGTDDEPLGHVFFLDIRRNESNEATTDELDFFRRYER